MSLDGKISIITGASRGIGAGIARAFAAEGCQVVGIGRDVEALNAVVEDIESKGGVCTPIIADVTDPNQVNHAVEQVLEKFGKIDILVNNAGIALYKPCLEMSVAEWQRVIDVNLRGVYICTHAVLPCMVERGVGHIIFISSDAGKFTFAGGSAYNVSKHGVQEFAATLRKELDGRGVKITTICPGGVATEILGPLPSLPPGERHHSLTVEELAEVVLFVANRPSTVNIDDLMVHYFRSA
ncbi:SDR family oxidoreductase [Candidatus Poribacteria bacterium]|nr:SDR family oxidoreductase [Candidatus Poribacteria bacterium]